MGDPDLTYDFREIKPFIDKLDEGFEFVIGSRYKGYIEPGAMPKLHQYFGTPVTTWILNFIYGSSYSDIHCGMRAITLDALRKINLQSQSWEYASEMVLKAVKSGLRLLRCLSDSIKTVLGDLAIINVLAGFLLGWQDGRT